MNITLGEPEVVADIDMVKFNKSFIKVNKNGVVFNLKKALNDGLNIISDKEAPTDDRKKLIINFVYFNVDWGDLFFKHYKNRDKIHIVIRPCVLNGFTVFSPGVAIQPKNMLGFDQDMKKEGLCCYLLTHDWVELVEYHVDKMLGRNVCQYGETTWRLI